MLQCPVFNKSDFCSKQGLCAEEREECVTLGIAVAMIVDGGGEKGGKVCSKLEKKKNGKEAFDT